MERLGVFDTDLAAFDLEGAVREHRRAKWHRRLIADVEDHLGELHCWPYKEQRLVLDAQPVGRKDIFRFVLFALGNRVPPRPIVVLLCGLGLLSSAKKRRDAWDVLRGFRDGTLDSDSFYWDVDEGRVLVHGLGSWCAGGVPLSMRDPIFWKDAQRMLGC